jgi:hypothetical protein
VQHPDCAFTRVRSAEIVSRDAKSITEAWTIEACKQQTFTYKVLILSDTETLTDAISNLDGAPINVTEP